MSKIFDRAWGSRVGRSTAMLVVLVVSCINSSFPRETTASNARADDPWLEGGELCATTSGGAAGLRLETLEVGTGREVRDGDTVRVHYVAKTPDGTTVHDTRQDGPPIELVVGSTKVLCGFERGLVGMRAGEQRRVTVPWPLAFGELGKPPAVPPRTDLVFVVDLFVPAEPTLEHGSAPVKPPGGRGGGRGGR